MEKTESKVTNAHASDPAFLLLETCPVMYTFEAHTPFFTTALITMATGWA